MPAVGASPWEHLDGVVGAFSVIVDGGESGKSLWGRECWERAEALSAPPLDETTAPAALAAAVNFAADTDRRRHVGVRRVLEDILRSGRRLVATVDTFTARLHWTYWFMAQRLFETSIYDPARRCTVRARKPFNATAAAPSLQDHVLALDGLLEP